MTKNLTYFGAFTLFVVFVWIALTVYSNFSSSTIPVNIDREIKPLEGSFNSKVINALNDRNQINANLSELPVAPSVTPIINQTGQIPISISVTPSPVASISAKPGGSL